MAAKMPYPRFSTVMSATIPTLIISTPRSGEYLADLDVVSGAKEFTSREEPGVKLMCEVSPSHRHVTVILASCGRHKTLPIPTMGFSS